MNQTNGQHLKFTIRAKTYSEALAILNKLNIEKLKNVSATNSKSPYMFDVQLSHSLLNEDYKTIKDEDKIAILYDSDSKTRILKMMDGLYELETRFKSLLLYLPQDIISIIKNFSKNKNKIDAYNDNSTTKDCLDPISSHLTLTEMINFFKTDISLTSQIKTDYKPIIDIIKESSTFEDFKYKILKASNQRLVWDIVAEKMLDRPVSWNEIEAELNKIKSKRNQAAHFHIVTESDKDKLLKSVDILLDKTTLKKKVKKSDIKSMQNELLNHSIDISNILSFNNEVMDKFKESFKSITENYNTYIQNLARNLSLPAINSIIESCVPRDYIDSLYNIDLIPPRLTLPNNQLSNIFNDNKKYKKRRK